MRVLFIVSLVFCNSQLIFAQADSIFLLNEAETKLKNKSASVSSILSDKNYLFLHPLTPFREVIKKYCTTDPVKITTDTEPGRKIKVLATLRDEDGKSIAGTVIYLYQTDAFGKFEIHTVKPSGYPQSELPAHIHVEVHEPAYQTIITEFLFDDDERLTGSIRTNSQGEGFIIAKPEKASLPFQQQFSYTITLQKN